MGNSAKKVVAWTAGWDHSVDRAAVSLLNWIEGRQRWILHYAAMLRYQQDYINLDCLFLEVKLPDNLRLEKEKKRQKLFTEGATKAPDEGQTRRLQGPHKSESHTTVKAWWTVLAQPRLFWSWHTPGGPQEIYKQHIAKLAILLTLYPPNEKKSTSYVLKYSTCKLGEVQKLQQKHYHVHIVYIIKYNKAKNSTTDTRSS